MIADQEPLFKAAVIELQAQRSGGRITGHDIRTLLEEQFQVYCCLNSVYNLLGLVLYHTVMLVVLIRLIQKGHDSFLRRLKPYLRVSVLTNAELMPDRQPAY